MHIHIEGVAGVMNKHGKKITVTRDFDALQTPTRVTHEILKAPNKLDAYIGWVKSVSETFKCQEYNGELNAWVTVDRNLGDDHIEDLNSFIKWCEADGFDIEFSEI